MIKVNLDKAKEIAHDKRREARAEEFKQLDIRATIPAMAVEAEAKRQEVREKYAEMQTAIDKSVTDIEIKEVISNII